MLDPQVDDAIKLKLNQVEEAMKFAKDEELNTYGAYEYYIHSSNDVVSYIVQAAFIDKLEFKTWWFPVLGSVPYKGFFYQHERDELASELKEQGFDVYKTGAAAFSSLGWFEDPIYTSMLERNKADLVHLFFHELTHRTFWSPGEAGFNENLAEFVASEMTKKYLTMLKEYDLLKTYEIKKQDKLLYTNWLNNLKNDLITLYENKNNLNKKDILENKNKIFQRYLKDDRPRFQMYNFISDSEWNNARVLGASLYVPETERFEKAYECLGKPKMGSFLKSLKEANEVNSGQFVALDSLCLKNN